METTRNDNQGNKVDVDPPKGKGEGTVPGGTGPAYPSMQGMLRNKLRGPRVYFDSATFEMANNGKADDSGELAIGRKHPSPESIPHPSSLNPHNRSTPSLQHSKSQGHAGSPVKESSFLHRGISIDEQDGQDGQDGQGKKDELDTKAGAISPPPHIEGVPIQGA